MKLITAIVKPFQLDEIIAALRRIGVNGVTVSEARGFGRQGGHTETFRGAEYRVDFLPKLRLEVACRDEEADGIFDTVVSTAATGRIGDGKIWISTLDRIARIRTREEGVDAI